MQACYRKTIFWSVFETMEESDKLNPKNTRETKNLSQGNKNLF